MNLGEISNNLFYNDLAPKCDVRSLNNLACTCKRLYILVSRMDIWRKVTYILDPERYNKLYRNIPPSVPFFGIYSVEVKMRNIEEKSKILKSYDDINCMLIILNIDVITMICIVNPLAKLSFKAIQSTQCVKALAIFQRLINIS